MKREEFLWDDQATLIDDNWPIFAYIYLILYQSIALCLFYQKSFGSNLIQSGIQPLIQLKVVKMSRAVDSYLNVLSVNGAQNVPRTQLYTFRRLFFNNEVTRFIKCLVNNAIYRLWSPRHVLLNKYPRWSFPSIGTDKTTPFNKCNWIWEVVSSSNGSRVTTRFLERALSLLIRLIRSCSLELLRLRFHSFLTNQTYFYKLVLSSIEWNLIEIFKLITCGVIWRWTTCCRSSSPNFEFLYLFNSSSEIIEIYTTNSPFPLLFNKIYLKNFGLFVREIIEIEYGHFDVS